jgi:hypothetical protein
MWRMKHRVGVKGRSALVAALSVFLGAAVAHAQTRPTPPARSSRPGAAYTLYLNFSGFNYPGTWNAGEGFTFTPGSSAAYSVDADTTTFNSTEVANINAIWARAAQKFSPFNINVTTVDPAPAGSSDAQRLASYDNRARFMHTVVGGTGSWIGSAGVSNLGTTALARPGSNGLHTNFVFANLFPSNVPFIGETIAHENGHGLGLYHQGDFIGGTSVNEYSQGNSTIAPIMGGSSGAGRGTWAVGSIYFGVEQNDVADIMLNEGMQYVNAGVGRSLATATPLPLGGSGVNVVDFSRAKGTIVPLSTFNPLPLNALNYSSDFWSFNTTGGIASFVAYSGSSFLIPGTPDPGSTLDVTLQLLAADGSVLVNRATPRLFETFTTTLAPGTYYLRIASSGGVNDASYTPYNPRSFFDLGDYFITGSINGVVPEPAALAFILVVAMAVLARTHGSRAFAT